MFLDEMKENVSKGAKKPSLLYYREIQFPHRGVSMPQWSSDATWLAVQSKPIRRRYPYQLNLFYLPNNGKLKHSIIYDKSRRNSAFFSFKWSKRKKSKEFCVISGGFQLFIGEASSSHSEKIIVTPLFRTRNIAQTSWVHSGEEDFIMFLRRNRIFTGKLTQKEKGKNRIFKRYWPLGFRKSGYVISRVNSFSACESDGKIHILLCGKSNKGEGAFKITMKNDLKTVEKIEKIGGGIYKLPSWSSDGKRAFVYRLEKITKNSSNYELYLHIYTDQGSGKILSNYPTILNLDKPEHDYLGVSWARWNSKNSHYEGIGHFFKKSEIKQQFKMISLPLDTRDLKYEDTRINMGGFQVAFGRGRRFVFAKNESYKVCFVYYDPTKQRSNLYLGLLNFKTY